jgi:phage internal scaffolding protein
MTKSNKSQHSAKLIRGPYALGTRARVSVTCGASKTDQSFKDECDINKIMSRYLKTGEFAHVNHNKPVYIDCPSVDYLQALEVVGEAGEAFDAMPADIRDRFKNDPTELLRFLEDNSNYEEAVDLGLINTEASLKFKQSQEKAILSHSQAQNAPSESNSSLNNQSAKDSQ